MGPEYAGTDPLNEDRPPCGGGRQIVGSRPGDEHNRPERIRHYACDDERTQGVRSPADWVTVPGGAAGTARRASRTYIDGTLVVKLYDAQTKKMVWRGVATATASDKPSKNMSKMNKALDKMFEKFPIRQTPTN